MIINGNRSAPKTTAMIKFTSMVSNITNPALFAPAARNVMAGIRILPDIKTPYGLPSAYSN